MQGGRQEELEGNAAAALYRPPALRIDGRKAAALLAEAERMAAALDGRPPPVDAPVRCLATISLAALSSVPADLRVCWRLAMWRPGVCLHAVPKRCACANRGRAPAKEALPCWLCKP